MPPIVCFSAIIEHLVQSAVGAGDVEADSNGQVLGGAHSFIEHHVSLRPSEAYGDIGRGGAGESDAGIGGINTTYAHTTHDASTKFVHHAAADSGSFPRAIRVPSASHVSLHCICALASAMAEKCNEWWPPIH